MKPISNISTYINKIPNSIKDSKYPLTKLNLKNLEGVQSDICLFNSEKPLTMDTISFITKRFETLNLFL